MDSINYKFSIFPAGWWDEKKQEVVMNQRPQQTVSLDWVYRYIRSDSARKATEEFRELPENATKLEKRQFKILNFMHATFSGTFSYRNAKSLISQTRYRIIDIDGLPSIEVARGLQDMLCRDPYVETLLAFVSPSARGVKWIVNQPEWTQGMTFKQQIDSLIMHVEFHYGIAPDTTGCDICRTCFLPWDSECYINKKFTINP